MGITRADLYAIRAADTMVFSHNVEHDGERGPWLRTVKEVRGTDGSIDYAQEQERWIRLARTGIVTYEGGWGDSDSERKPYPTENYGPERVHGSVVLMTLSLNDAVKTWARAARTGDDLGVTFLVGNNNDNLRNAGLSQDEAWLHIYRDNRLVGKYFLDSTIAPVWSTARMVRPLFERV